LVSRVKRREGEDNRLSAPRGEDLKHVDFYRSFSNVTQALLYLGGGKISFVFVVMPFLLPNARENGEGGGHHYNKFSLKYSTSNLANVHTTARVMLRLNDLVFFQLVSHRFPSTTALTVTTPNSTLNFSCFS